MSYSKKSKWLDTSDAMRFLRCSLMTLWRYRGRGLPYIVNGREVFFRLVDLQEWKRPKIGRPKKGGGKDDEERAS